MPRSKKPLYWVWVSMRQRCRNSKCPEYVNYGGRGISICKEWDDFDAFENWAASSGYARGLSIDRIDNDGDYTPDNCRWADNYTQAANKRSGRNKTGANGIHMRPNGRFRAQIMRRGKRFNIGDFGTVEEAKKAREEFLNEYKHGNACLC